MKKQFGKNRLGVHLMMGGGVEYALCGFPETVDPKDKETVEFGNIEPTSETVVTCPTCSHIIKNCRGVIVGEDDPDIFDPEGAKRYPYTAAVEMYLGGIGQAVYSDGVQQFIDQDVTPPVAYSPRLNPDEMEQFCRKNLDQYKTFYDQNKTAIEQRDPIPAIDPFWENGI